MSVTMLAAMNALNEFGLNSSMLMSRTFY